MESGGPRGSNPHQPASSIFAQGTRDLPLQDPLLGPSTHGSGGFRPLGPGLPARLSVSLLAPTPFSALPVSAPVPGLALDPAPSLLPIPLPCSPLPCWPSLSTIYWPTVPRSISQPQPRTQAGTHCSRPSRHLRLSTCTTNSSPTPHPRPNRCLLQPSPQLEGTANLGAVRAMKKSQANPECTCSSTALPPSLKPPASPPDHRTPPCLAPTAPPSPLQCRLPPAASRLLS